MAKKHEPPYDPQRHGRRRIDTLYHRVMAYATAPETMRRTSRRHDHPAGADDGYELCLTCVTSQPSDTPRLDSVLYEAMFDQACIETDGSMTNPYVIESKLARSSQRKAMKDYFGDLWFVLIPAAYTLTTFTAADIARMASQVPASINPSHAALHLGNAAAADITGLPRAVACGSATAKLARMCAQLIEAHVHPVIFNPPRAARTSAQVIREAHRSRGASSTPRVPRPAAAARAVSASRAGAGAGFPAALAPAAPDKPAPAPARTALTAQAAAAAAQAPTTGKDWRTVLFGDMAPAEFLSSLATTPAASAKDELDRKKRLIEHTLDQLATQRAALDKQVSELSKQRDDLSTFDSHITSLLTAYIGVLDKLETNN
jgi:hypothetical protein